MSSSSKKKRPLIQCRFCDCFFLAKDIDEHRIGQQTPKGPKAKQTEVGEGHCEPPDFTHSQFAMIRPHFGLALRPHNSHATDCAAPARGECLFPVGLCGWTRHNSALVHPETLTVSGVKPRGVVLRLSSSGEWKGQLLSLWPSVEVPPMRILLPNSVPFPDESSFVRLAILPTSSVHISKMFLQPKLSASELPLELWAKLAQLSHFQLFIRSFFYDAFFCELFDELVLFYYGKRLIFCISDMEFANESERNTTEEGKGEAEPKMGGQSEVGDGVGKDKAAGNCGRKSAEIHRISPMCAFDIRWDEVREKNARRKEEDDPESLC